MRSRGSDRLDRRRRAEPFDSGSVRVCSVAGLLDDAIGRLHHDRPLDDLLLHA